MRKLENHIDGIDGVDLGVHGQCQYALESPILGPVQVYRRPRSHEGTYGGWRWECSAMHAILHRSVHPTLVDAIERAVAEASHNA
jgi:hypothetical protein